VSHARRQPINLSNTMNDKPASESTDVVTSKGIGSSALLACFSVLGCEIFAKIAGRVADGEGDEWCHAVMEKSAALGIVRREEYSREKHGHLNMEAEPGDLVWIWDHLPPGWQTGTHCWESATMDGQRIESDPSKRQYLRILDRERFDSEMANSRITHTEK
jgi:hypothetical protein